MIERINKGSRVKEKDNQKIVFERIEEFEINNLEEAKASLRNINSALQSIDLNLERIKKHKKMLEYERDEIIKFIENFTENQK